jgi:hypothetical protein
VTGHLCSITFREAAEIGIDNLEHGLKTSTDFDSVLTLDTDGPEAQDLIQLLVDKGVALTSTPVLYEVQAQVAASGFGAASAVLNPRVLDAMSPETRIRYLQRRAVAVDPNNVVGALFSKISGFEHAFVEAGGHLMVGSDTTGNGGIIAGFANKRAIELLVLSGFTPAESIKFATLNGAQFLGEDERIGSIEVGKQADLVVVKGNPAADINDLENVEIVFKDGIGWDSDCLIESAQGMVGIR